MESIGKTHRIINSGYHDPQFFKQLWETISSGQIWEGEIRNKAKDGSYYWVKTTIVPMLGENAKPYRYIALHNDITQGKLVEQELREGLEIDYKRMVNALYNMVFKIAKRDDGTLVYTMSGGKLGKEIGLTTDKVYGKTPYDLFPKETADRIVKYIENAFNGQNVAFKSSYMEKYLYTSLSPIYENGQVIEIIGSTGDITELEKKEQEIWHMAYHDPLTDLPNRRMFENSLVRALENAYKHNQMLVVMFFDINRFKQINDTLGYTIGDRLLCKVSQRLRQAIGSYGEVYRLGGDEFILLLNSLEKRENIEDLAKHILSVIGTPFFIENHEFFVTGSIGISIFPEGGGDSETLMKNADTAKNYSKKKHGRNSYQIYDSSLNLNDNELLDLEIQLRKALERNEFILHYQPKVNVTTGKIVGMEALVRWIHPRLGYISPKNLFLSQKN